MLNKIRFLKEKFLEVEKEMLICKGKGKRN